MALKNTDAKQIGEGGASYRLKKEVICRRKGEKLVHGGSISQHKADSGAEKLAFEPIYDESSNEADKMAEFREPYG
jgi:hypothetical protein